MVYFLEGISGSGKSTYINNLLSDQHDQHSYPLVIHGDSLQAPFVKTQDGTVVIPPIEKYLQSQINVWKSFFISADSEKDIYISGGLLHGPEFVLIGLYELSREELFAHVEDMLLCVPCDFSMIYLQLSDVETNMETLLRDRSESNPEWVNGMCKFVENSPFCIKKGWVGKNGVCRYLKMMNEYDLYVIGRLGTNVSIISR